ncbi:hypothetical protein EDB84DRAFT_1526234, partial [Lactarius hengduanensis]
MPKGARSVSKLILFMSVSAILGSAWVGGAMKNWPAPSALRTRASPCEGCRDLIWDFLRLDHDDGDVVKNARSH